MSDSLAKARAALAAKRAAQAQAQAQEPAPVTWTEYRRQRLDRIAAEVDRLAKRCIALYEEVQAIKDGVRPQRHCRRCAEPVPAQRRPQSLYCSRACQKAGPYRPR